MFRRSGVIALGIIAGLSVVACGGGGGGGGSITPPIAKASAAPSAAPSSGSGQQSVAVAAATFKITIPPATSASSNHRSKKNVAAGTQSIVFTLTQSSTAGATLGVPSTPYALTASTPGCSSSTSGLQCSIGINAVVGTDVYTVTTYSSTNATPGTQLGSGAFAITVQANQQNTASLTLSGNVASVLMTSNIAYQYGSVEGIYAYGLTLGLPNQTALPSSGRLYAIAIDNQGNTILSPETYNAPIYVSLLAYSYSESSIARGIHPLSVKPEQVESPIYGQISVTYDSGDGAPYAGTTATTDPTTGIYTLPVYSPQDVITVSTTANDEYTAPSIYEDIYAYGATTGTVPSSLPTGLSLVEIEIFPDLMASPSPLPSPSPSPSPSPAPSSAPLTDSGSTLAVNQTGAASFTVTELGYTGSYTVTSDNTAAVTANSPVTAAGYPWATTIGITAVAAGIANVTVTDSHNQSVTVTVTVTTTPVTIQGHEKGKGH